MRLVFSNEAYAQLDKVAKVKGKTTRQLGVEIILSWLGTNKS